MKKLFIPTGYMGSGSSAITGLLSEFEGVFADYGEHEYVFTHCPNGLFDLEDKLLQGNNAIRSDEAIHSFLATMTELYDKRYWWVGHYKDTFGEDFLKLTQEFVESIITVETDQYWYYQENTNFKMAIKLVFNRILKLVSLNKVKGRKPLLYPNMWVSIPSEEEFYNAAKHYLDRLFEMIGLDKRNLILDQLLLPFNLFRFENYFDKNTYPIVVSRDPRDVFISNKYIYNKQGVGVPYPTDVNAFCDYYKRMRLSEKGSNSDQIIRINFEDLIYKYDETLEMIINRTGLSSSDHLRKKENFNPEISIRNTQIFTGNELYSEEVRIIEEKLSEYLYDFPFERKTDLTTVF